VQSSRVRRRAERLRTPEQFAAVAGERATWRAAGQRLAASARVEPKKAGSESEALGQSGDRVEHRISLFSFESQPVGVRFGLTVARRQVRHAVRRVMVKRVLREAIRHAADTLRPLARDCSVDLVLRLRSPLPEPSQMSRAQLKRALRSEADSLIAQLARHLSAGAR